MGNWWSELELWAQLGFMMLGASIFVMGLGIAKLVWMRIQRKKYMKKPTEKAELGESETTQEILQSKNEDIPFGIRALEAGVEVEGVVISRPTSPRISQHNGSNLTLHDGARGSYASLMATVQNDSPRHSLGPPSPGLNSSFSQNGQQPLVQPPRAVHQPNPYSNAPFNHGASSSTVHNIPSYHSSPAITRNSSVENVIDNNFQRNQISRGGSPLSSVPQTRPSLANVQRRSGSGHPVDGRSITPHTPRSPSPPEGNGLPSVQEYEVGKTSRASDRSGSTQDENNVTPTDAAAEEDSRDLSLMRSHRLSHAAEVGQLARRTPVPRPQSLPPSASPNATVYPTTASPLYAVDAKMPHAPTPEPIDFTPPARMSISTFQFNQNVDLARELFQPHLAAQGTPSPVTPSTVNENTLWEGQNSRETSPSRPKSIKSPKKLQKNR